MYRPFKAVFGTTVFPNIILQLLQLHFAISCYSTRLAYKPTHGICDNILVCFQKPHRPLSLSCSVCILYSDHLLKTNFLLYEHSETDPELVPNSILFMIFSHFHFLVPQNGLVEEVHVLAIQNLLTLGFAFLSYLLQIFSEQFTET